MLLAIDEGTTGTACVVFDLGATLEAMAYRAVDAVRAMERAGSASPEELRAEPPRSGCL
jgi:glycerol kinase